MSYSGMKSSELTFLCRYHRLRRLSVTSGVYSSAGIASMLLLSFSSYISSISAVRESFIASSDLYLFISAVRESTIRPSSMFSFTRAVLVLGVLALLNIPVESCAVEAPQMNCMPNAAMAAAKYRIR